LILYKYAAVVTVVSQSISICYSQDVNNITTCKNPRKRLVVHSNRLKKYTSQKEDEGCPEDNWIILYSQVEQMGAPETVSPVQEETAPERQVESESLQESHKSISP